MTDPTQVPTEVRETSQHFADLRPMRRGSVSKRFVKCSKADCACARSADRRHGPYYSLTKAVQGQTRSRLLTEAQATLAQRQIDTGRRFREQTDAFWKAAEAWADHELDESAAASQETVKKGGSKKPSRPRRSRRSKL